MRLPRIDIKRTADSLWQAGATRHHLPFALCLTSLCPVGDPAAVPSSANGPMEG